MTWLCNRYYNNITISRSFTKISQRLIFLRMEINELTESIIGCAIEVHRNLGPGLLESAYQECLFYELREKGIWVEKEISLPVIYKEIKIDHGYRIDLLVENRIVVELKTVEKFTEVHTA